MWIQTYTGKKFRYDNLADNEYDINDIAHSLAMQPRYGGHCLAEYSIAEHCALLHDYCAAKGYEPDVCYWALMHDAPEAYLLDLFAPLKEYLRSVSGEARSAYDVLESNIMTMIALRHGLSDFKPPSLIKELDYRIRGDEAAQVMSACEWDDSFVPLGIQTQRWPWPTAETMFKHRYRECRKALGHEGF